MRGGVMRAGVQVEAKVSPKSGMVSSFLFRQSTVVNSTSPGGKADRGCGPTERREGLPLRSVCAAGMFVLVLGGGHNARSSRHRHGGTSRPRIPSCDRSLFLKCDPRAS